MQCAAATLQEAMGVERADGICPPKRVTVPSSKSPGAVQELS